MAIIMISKYVNRFAKQWRRKTLRVEEDTTHILALGWNYNCDHEYWMKPLPFEVDWCLDSVFDDYDFRDQLYDYIMLPASRKVDKMKLASVTGFPQQNQVIFIENAIRLIFITFANAYSSGHQIINFLVAQPFDGAVASRKPDGTVFEGNFKRGAPHGYFRWKKAYSSTPITSFAGTSTPSETWSSLVV